MAAMADAVHRHGALAGVELWHGGQRSGNVLSRAAGLPPQSLLAENVPWQCQRMDRDDIAKLRAWHRAAALRARDAGFDVVYFYAAHSYLLSQFMDGALNPRGDEYGGSFANRARLVRELLEDTRAAVGDRMAVALRIEVVGEDGSEREERAEFLNKIKYLVDMFDVTIPDYGVEMGPSRFFRKAALETHVAHIRAATGKPVVSVGHFTSPETMLSQLNRGVLDFIGAARPPIAAPFLPAKIRECIGCNICYAHDGLGAPTCCTQNPTMGEEFHQGGHPEHVTGLIGSKMTAENTPETTIPPVMIATGSLWRADGRGRSLPGGHASYADARTLTPDQVLDGARPTGPVVIFDDEGYDIAAGLADLLASEGHAVTYITPAGTVAEWTSYTVEQSRLQASLIDQGVTILTGQIVTSLGPKTAHLTCVYTGRTTQIPCGGFIPVTSQETLWLALKSANLTSLLGIGYARAPGLIAHAVQDGHATARSHPSPPILPRRERVIVKALAA